jgi:hypothetical protein
MQKSAANPNANNRAHPYSRGSNTSEDTILHDQNFKYCPDKALKYKAEFNPRKTVFNNVCHTFL